MKKILRMNMWSYYLAMALCLGFAACTESIGDDGDNGGGGDGGTGQSGFWGRSLQYFEDENEDGKFDNKEYCDNTVFSYDNQGRIIKATITYYDEGEVDDYWTYSYSYETNKIIEIEEEIGDGNYYDKHVYNLNDKGLITSVERAGYHNGQIAEDYPDHFYEYDDQNRLIRKGRNNYYEDPTEIVWTNVIWEGDNLVAEEGDNTFTYYLDQPDTKGVNGLAYYFADDFGFLYAQGYYGKKSAYLIKTENDDEVYTYTWTGDQIKDITVLDENESYRFSFNY